MSTVTSPSPKVKQWQQEALAAIGRVPKPDKGQVARIRDEAKQQSRALEELRTVAKKKVDELKAVADDAENRRQQKLGLPGDRPWGKDGQEAAEKEDRKSVELVSTANANVEQAKKEVTSIDEKIKAAKARAEKADAMVKSGSDEDLDPEMERAFKVVLAHELVEAKEKELNDSMARFEKAEKLRKRPRRGSGKSDEEADPDWAAARRDVLDTIAAHEGAKLAATLLESDEDYESTPVILDGRREQAKQKAEAKKKLLETAASQTKVAKDELDNKQAALDREILATPGLKEDAKEVDDAKALLAERRKDLVKAQNELKTQLANLARYRNTMNEATEERKPDYIRLIARVSPLIADANATVEQCKRAVNVVKQRADQAEKNFKASLAEHVDENPESKVAKGVSAVDASKSKVSHAERLETEAGEDHALAAGRSAELDRRAKVLEELPKAKVALAALQDLLKKHGLEDTPVWTGSATLVANKADQAELMKLAKELGDHYESLRINGATTAELGDLYKDFPEKWRPPQFREDEKNWSAVSAMFAEESRRKARPRTRKARATPRSARKSPRSRAA